jgi:23S rRNA (uracil1939-C5)-methyltransferase
MANEMMVKPTRWSPRGEAIADLPDGKPIHVWNGIVGEHAEIRAQHRGQNQWAGYFLGTHTPHKTRVNPPCRKFVGCGGCPVMHMNPAGQWDTRRALVEMALREHGLNEVVLGEQHDCPDGHSDYRHLVKLGAGYSDEGRIRIGAWGRRNRAIVPIPKCNVAAPILVKTMRAIAHQVVDLQIRPYDVERDEGVLRAVVMRASRATGHVLVTLILGRRIRELRDLADNITDEVHNVVGVWYHNNTEVGNAIFHADEEGVVGVGALSGQAWIEEVLNGVRYRIGPGDFFQTNPSTAEVLYRRTMDRIELSKDDSYIDLYSGVGGLALQGASRAGWTMGVEEVAGAVLRAQDSARLNGLQAEFRTDSALDALPDLKRRVGHRGPILTVNPARRGLEEGVIAGIIDLKPRRMAYVSCNPRSLARDLVQFKDAGWSIGEIELFDMFPNTPHVESLVTLEPPGSMRVTSAPPPKRRLVRKK